jgi:hypothetical protein
MGTHTPMECGIWLKITAQVGPSAPVCCDEFSMHKTEILMVVHIKLHHRNVLVLVSKTAGLQFVLVECIHGAQYLLD